MKVVAIVMEFFAALGSAVMLYYEANGPQNEFTFPFEVLFAVLLGVSLVAGFIMLLETLREAGWGQ